MYDLFIAEDIMTLKYCWYNTINKNALSADLSKHSLIIDGKFIADFFLQNDQEAVTCS